MLQGTSLQKAAADITSASDMSWEELQPVLIDGCAQGLIPRDLLDRELFTWSFSTLLSRLVKLPGSGGVDACVPWADMLNHNPHVSTFFEYDQGTRSVILRPDKSYQKGEQVIRAAFSTYIACISMVLSRIVKPPDGGVECLCPMGGHALAQSTSQKLHRVQPMASSHALFPSGYRMGEQ